MERADPPAALLGWIDFSLAIQTERALDETVGEAHHKTVGFFPSGSELQQLTPMELSVHRPPRARSSRVRMEAWWFAERVRRNEAEEA